MSTTPWQLGRTRFRYPSYHTTYRPPPRPRCPPAGQDLFYRLACFGGREKWRNRDQTGAARGRNRAGFRASRRAATAPIVAYLISNPPRAGAPRSALTAPTSLQNHAPVSRGAAWRQFRGRSARAPIVSLSQPIERPYPAPAPATKKSNCGKTVARPQIALRVNRAPPRRLSCEWNQRSPNHRAGSAARRRAIGRNRPAGRSDGVDLVPEAGLEPAWIAPSEFESLASTIPPLGPPGGRE